MQLRMAGLPVMLYAPAKVRLIFAGRGVPLGGFSAQTARPCGGPLTCHVAFEGYVLHAPLSASFPSNSSSPCVLRVILLDKDLWTMSERYMPVA
jgi:hypothetical protein